MSDETQRVSQAGPGVQSSMTTKNFTQIALVAAILAAVLLTACGKAEPPSQPGKEKDGSLKETEEKKGGKPDEKSEKGEKGEKERGVRGNVKLSDEEMQNAGVKAQEVQLSNVSAQIILTATIHINQDRLVHVAPRVPARVVKVQANLGDKVKAGQPLALLDSMELGEANSVYKQAQSQFALAEADYERAKKLKVEDIIPEKDFIRARSEYEKAKAGLRAADERLRLFGVTQAASGPNPPSVFPLNAPFAGTVIEKKAVLGELAQPDKSIFTVADLSTLWIEANLFEKDLAKIRIGARAAVSVTAYPDETFNGKVTYISSVVDKDSRTVQTRIELSNAAERLKPEMFATVAIDTGSTSKQLYVPEKAVLLVNGMPTVFVDQDGEYEPRPVEIGEKSAGQVAINAGIKAGEWVVVSGAFAIKAKMLKSQISDSD